MKKEGTIGAGAILAVAAVLGLTLQSGPKSESGAKTQHAVTGKRAEQPRPQSGNREIKPGCSSLESRLKEFLSTPSLTLPAECDGSSSTEPRRVSPARERPVQPQFVIATLPDPLHTHLSFLFDQFTVAIQDGAQDEQYDFDNSWFPWENEEESYSKLADQDAIDLRKEMRETEPGIILFRKAADCARTPEAASTKTAEAKQLTLCIERPLVVFVVGEDATHGIHREQFRNAVRWIDSLQPHSEAKPARVGILGPSFSGSLPSLTLLLKESEAVKTLDLEPRSQTTQLTIHSGGVSGKRLAESFQQTWNRKDQQKIVFHSFVQNDDEILERFCRYMRAEQPEFDSDKVAIISEDETAYGSAKMEGADCSKAALKLFYPRDISALRGAYQAKSIFDASGSPQPADNQRRNLPTDLADPSGKVHDSVPSYGGNQTPLTQEAFLLEIVAALRQLHSRYILLRSSSALDQLFLTNFLRRMYPDGRIVIVGSDIGFTRERGSTGLGGTMTLSTYPLFPLARDWTEFASRPASDRVFSSDTAEGTYIAFRLLLNTGRLDQRPEDGKKCRVVDDDQAVIFVPRVVCTGDSPIPDYLPPYWMLPDDDGESTDGSKALYLGPGVWLSVIGSNRFWPLAALVGEKLEAQPDKTKFNLHSLLRSSGRNKEEPGRKLEMPLGMKLLLLILLSFSIFNAWCCGSGSYTAKPAFRAHFASTGDSRHTRIILLASFCVAALGILAGWACGIFLPSAYEWFSPLFAMTVVSFVCLMSWAALLANRFTVWKLSQRENSEPQGRLEIAKAIIVRSGWLSLLLLVALILFVLLFIHPVETVLQKNNHVLTYWRAMYIDSGVSPLVPLFSIFAGLYIATWLALHGLALFGPDRPRLPALKQLWIEDQNGQNLSVLRMFSHEDAASRIESVAMPLTLKTEATAVGFCALFLCTAWAMAGGVPVRSLGAQSYTRMFLIWLVFCISLMLAETWRLYDVWEELRRLLAFLDRLPLRRTMAALHGFSWGSVWRMSGNVLEIRYKVISRQLESMNHTRESIKAFIRSSGQPEAAEFRNSVRALNQLHQAGIAFAKWYAANYQNVRAGDLGTFSAFQENVAAASGVLMTNVLMPAWRNEEKSLILARVQDGKENSESGTPPLAAEEHIRNAEEFVCLTYLAFIQNVLGRLRTMAMTVVALFIAATLAVSSYPFDPREALSVLLVVLFLIAGVVIVKVYAEMHRDATLSHVTNTKPGELGTEFWFKLIGFGFAPLVGLLTRVFPGMTDFIFSWVQPGISSLK